MDQYKFILTYDGESETFTHNPEGWDRLGITYLRNKTFHGILRRFSNDTFRFLRVDGGGGEFIIDAFDDKDIEANVTIQIYDRNSQTDDYDIYYTGILDFDPKRYREERDYVEVGVIESSKLQKFSSRNEIEMDVTQRVSLDDVTMQDFTNMPKDITFKPINIYLELNCTLEGFYIVEGGGYDDTFFLSDSDYTDKTLNFYCDEDNDLNINEIEDRFPLVAGPNYEDRSIKMYDNTTGEAVVIIIDDLSINESNMQHSGVSTGGGSYYESIFELKLIVRNSDDTAIETQIIATKTWSDVFESYTDFTFTWNGLTNNELDVPIDGYVELYLIHYLNGPILNSESNIIGRLFLDLDYYEKRIGAIESDVECFLPFEAFTRLIQLMTSETDTDKLLQSTFLGRTDSEFWDQTTNGTGALDAITCGLKLRQYPNIPLNLSFSDLFKTFDALYNLGVGYDFNNDYFYIEQKSEFYQNDYLMFDLGDVIGLIITPFPDSYFSEIESGYEEEGDYEDFAGVHEINIKTGHSTSLVVKDKKLIRSPYNGDSIGMELARRKNKNLYFSEDTKYDEKIYIVRTDGSETTQGGFGPSGIEGIDEFYNLDLTPRENLIRWSNILRSGLWKQTSPETIKFLKASKKTDISYFNQNEEWVHEFDDLDSDTDLLTERLFNPEYYEFEAPITKDMLSVLDENPHGLIKFEFDNEYYQGFLDELQYSDYEQIAKWKLIAYDATQDVQKVHMNGKDAEYMEGDKHKFL